MSNTVMFITFKLKEGASVEAFLLASERLNDEVFSKNPACHSWRQLREGDQWADLLIWETMEDAQKAMEMDEGGVSPSMEEFCSFLDQESVAHHLFSIERSY